jgi:hypothetical protein
MRQLMDGPPDDMPVAELVEATLQMISGNGGATT